jgi:hypothetical protein
MQTAYICLRQGPVAGCVPHNTATELNEILDISCQVSGHGSMEVLQSSAVLNNHYSYRMAPNISMNGVGPFLLRVLPADQVSYHIHMVSS